MKRYLFFLLLGITAFDCSVNAQMVRVLPLYPQGKIQQPVFQQHLIIQRNMSCFDAAASYSLSRYSRVYSFRYILPKGAIFCRMEDAIYNKLNFWVKFRMGTDDRYSN